MMVGNIAADAGRAINLLQQQGLDKLMGKSHFREAEDFIAFFN